MRPSDPAAVAEEARSLARRLSDAQLRALAAGRDVQETIAPSLATADRGGAGRCDRGSDVRAAAAVPDHRHPSGRRAFCSAGQTRDFQVSGVTEFGAQGGNLGGCGVPAGGAEPMAAAVMLNLVAIDVAGKGNLAAWAYGEPEPARLVDQLPDRSGP